MRKRKTYLFLLTLLLGVVYYLPGTVVEATTATEHPEIKTVEAPVADVKAGSYYKTQSITLTTRTEDAVIYYTTDGSTPSKKNGTKYKRAIRVTGIRGKSKTTTIKAIAIKEEMQNSEVVTFTYKIKLPKYKLLSITPPKSITGLPNGTPYTVKGLGLPRQVAVSVEGNGIKTANVTWNLNYPIKGCYHETTLTKQTFRIQGTVKIPNTYDLNGKSTTVAVNVTVDEHEHEFKKVSSAEDSGHWEVIREATCTTAGLKRRECSSCFYYEEEEIPNISHSYGEWVVVEEPTYAKEGLERSTCDSCEDTKERVLEKLVKPMESVKPESTESSSPRPEENLDTGFLDTVQENESCWSHWLIIVVFCFYVTVALLISAKRQKLHTAILGLEAVSTLIIAALGSCTWDFMFLLINLIIVTLIFSVKLKQKN